MSETDRLAGKTRGHLQAIVAGNVTNPTIGTLRAYARVWGCSTAYLAEGEGTPPTDEAVRAAVARSRQQPGAEPTASDFTVDPKAA